MSTLALRIAFEVMFEKENLILLKGKRNLICKLKCVNHKHKWRCSGPPMEIAPSPLLTALHLGSDDLILSDSTICPRALKPSSRKGGWGLKSTIVSPEGLWHLQSAWPTPPASRVICPFGARDVRVPGKLWVTGHYGCQSRGSQWHVRCSENWNHLVVLHLSGVAFSHWSYPNPLPLQNCRFYVVERILVLLNKMQIW